MINLSRLLKSSIKYEDTTQRGTRTKGLKTREVAQLAEIDQALISKFESGNRRPKKNRVKLILLEIDFESIMVSWLKKRLFMKRNDEFALKALQAAEED
jgi:transcriptional regulator with XRE-family HTH domain